MIGRALEYFGDTALAMVFIAIVYFAGNVFFLGAYLP